MRACVYLMLLCVVLAGCGSKKSSADQKSVGMKQPVFELVGTAVSANVQNGSAFERAVIGVSQFDALVIPDDARIETSTPRADLTLLTKKTLDYRGHPSKPVDIRVEYKNAGCAYRIDGSTMTVATYGEWWSKEGGLQMQLIFLAPPTTRVLRKRGLSGEESEASPDAMSILEHAHSLGVPVKGWNPVELELHRWADKYVTQ